MTKSYDYEGKGRIDKHYVKHKRKRKKVKDKSSVEFVFVTSYEAILVLIIRNSSLFHPTKDITDIELLFCLVQKL